MNQKTIPVAADWPFITIRQSAGPVRAQEKMREVIRINAARPGSCDCYWFCCDGAGMTLSHAKARAESLVSFRPACEQAGIEFSYQQGVTLRHGGQPPADADACYFKYPDDAWSRDRNGGKCSYYCPSSPVVLAHQTDYAEMLARTLHPVAIWLDDDLRLCHSKTETCFCDRCIRLFNEACGEHVTRESLVKRLWDNPDPDPIRSRWFSFNAGQLARFGAATRAGLDKVNPSIRLAYQSVDASMYYTGPDYRPLLWALSGEGRVQTAIRIGSGHYFERHPREVLDKMMSVIRETERTRAFGSWIGQCSYEMENYTREVLHKSPEAVMIESALALAAGCDALTLYWWDAARDEPLAYYEEFADEVVRYRPYLERVAAVSKRTRAGGAAYQLPQDYLNLKRDFTSSHRLEGMLLSCGIPLTVTEAHPAACYTDDDLNALRLNFPRIPTTSELEAFRDKLDERSGGNMPVRAGKTHAVALFPRIGGDGGLHAVTVANMSIGRMQGMTLRLRHPAGKRFIWTRPDESDVELKVGKGMLPTEVGVTVPELPGYAVGTIYCV